jgi:hypothetical protein
MMNKLPNILLVAGTGRNVGKTSFICEVIRKVSDQQKVVAVKISPHAHKKSYGEDLLKSNNNFIISEETDLDSKKDSSRMLRAGAHQVFYIQALDYDLSIVFEELNKLIPDDSAIICESGGLRFIIEPGLFIVCKGNQQSEMKERLKELTHTVDEFVVLNENSYQLVLQKINFESNSWILK